MQQVTAISEKQTLHSGQAALTLFPEVFPASHLVQQGKEREKLTPAICGRKCLEQLEKFNHVGLLAKMYLACLIGTGAWSSTKSKLTWKLRGLRFSHQLYCQLVASMPPTAGTGFLLLLTPTTIDIKPDNARKENRTRHRAKTGRQWSPGSLTEQIFHQLLPTATARDYKGARTQEALTKAGRTQANSLPDYFSQVGKTSQLNPQFVEEMMGYPIGWTELKR